MIDPDVEQLLSMAEAPAAIPAVRGGKRVHPSCVYRWILRGIRGVRLEAVQIGGRRFTSREAIQRFFAALSSVSGLDPAPGGANIRSPNRRQRDHAAAVGSLEASGWATKQEPGQPQLAEKG